MQLKEMFRKPIDREIQGVIIVGQGEETNVSQELEEYVVTRELQKHFADFFSAYKKGIVGTTPKMGVWISGFFGSGKSHFLKILSYLLENKQVGDRSALDYFVEDEKIADPMVLADMKLAAETPTAKRRASGGVMPRLMATAKEPVKESPQPTVLTVFMGGGVAMRNPSAQRSIAPRAPSETATQATPPSWRRSAAAFRSSSEASGWPTMAASSFSFGLM